MSYLDHPAFQEPHDGPLITGRKCDGRSPSLEQIAKRAEVIRRHVPRDPVGPQFSADFPVASAGVFGLR